MCHYRIARSREIEGRRILSSALMPLGVGVFHNAFPGEVVSCPFRTPLFVWGEEEKAYYALNIFREHFPEEIFELWTVEAEDVRQPFSVLNPFTVHSFLTVEIFWRDRGGLFSTVSLPEGAVTCTSFKLVQQVLA